MRLPALPLVFVLLAACGGKGCKGEAANEPRASDPAGSPAELRIPTGEPRELEALRAKQAAEGPVNYKQYAPLLPERVGPYKAANALEGLNEQIAEGVVLATAIRQYREGERLVIITIADALVNVVAPLLRGEKPREDTPDLGKVTRGELGRYPALFCWFEGGNESRAYALVSGRVVEVRVVGASNPEDAREVARQLDLDALAAVRGEKKPIEEREAGQPPSPAP